MVIGGEKVLHYLKDINWALIGEVFGGVLVAIYAIWNISNKFLDQTTHRKNKQEEKIRLEREKFNKYLADALTPIIEPLKEAVEEVKEINKEQSELLKDLTTSEKDCLRKMIMDIYHLYEDTRAFPESIKEQLDELYADYKSLHGNSYIDKYYNRMLKWESIPDNNIVN
jgi:hypothetical protein